MKWETVKLAELYEVHNGLSKGREFFGTGFPFLTFSTVFNNYFIPEKLDSLVQSTDKEQQDYSIKRGDVFVTRTSETADELGMSCVALKDYPCATYNGFTKRMRPTSIRVVPEYIGYYMRMPSFRNKFQAFSTMTTRASLKNEDLLSLEIALPGIEEQQRIAGVLMAYDSLIENNHKQIKLLEEAAQRLYKEWFIDLLFPGHESTPIHDGIPEGWEKTTVDKVTSILRRGISPSYDENGDSTVINQKCIRQTIIDLSEARKQIKKYPLELNLQDGDTVICSTGDGTLGRVGQVFGALEKTTFDSHVTIVRTSNVVGVQLLFWTIKSQQSFLQGMGKGSTNQLELSRSVIQELPFILPDTKTKMAFEGLAQVIHEKITTQNKQIIALQTARDRLLPKLMSGEIEV